MIEMNNLNKAEISLLWVIIIEEISLFSLNK